MFWDNLENWLIGNMGTPGNYMYRDIHIHTLVVIGLVFAAILIPGYFLRKNEKVSRKLLVAVSIFQLVFEIGWRLVYLFVKKSPVVELWPMYPCNLNGILIPIIALLRLKKWKKLFYLFGFVGGILTFALPEGIFCTDVMVFPVLKSVLQHTGLILIPSLEYAADTYRPSLKDMGWITLGCTVHLINCEVIDRLLGFTGDYMFFRSGLPFVIPGVPQFITLSVFAMLVLALLAFLSDIKGSVAFLKKQKCKLRLP